MLSRTMSTRHLLRAASRGTRSFNTSTVLRQATNTAPVTPKKKPMGAFRGGLFGFLLGTVVSGSAAYLYLLEEYRVSNELLTEDIEALRTTIMRVEAYVKRLEEKIEVQQSEIVRRK